MASSTAIKSMKKTRMDQTLINLEPQCRKCTIEPLAIGEVVVVFGCGHWFHRACGEDWLRMQDFCPVCEEGDVARPFEEENADGTVDEGEMKDSEDHEDDVNGRPPIARVASDPKPRQPPRVVPFRIINRRVVANPDYTPTYDPALINRECNRLSQEYQQAVYAAYVLQGINDLVRFLERGSPYGWEFMEYQNWLWNQNARMERVFQAMVDEEDSSY